MSETKTLPLLTTLEKQIILVLGKDISEFNELKRYSSTSIKRGLNEYHQKYHLPYRVHIPYSTLKSLERKKLVECVYDTENRRIKNFFMLTEKGVQWYHKLKPIEDHFFSQ